MEKESLQRGKGNSRKNLLFSTDCVIRSFRDFAVKEIRFIQC